ncbi:MAG: hypothetical protein WCS37_06935 [Chloroflexota bacterium]|nr:hypothetical protein [Chloroflexota bacterium]
MPNIKENHTRIQNKTAKRLAIASTTKEEPPLILPPLGIRCVNSELLSKFKYDAWEKHGLIAVRSENLQKEEGNIHQDEFKAYLRTLTLVGAVLVTVVFLIIALWSLFANQTSLGFVSLIVGLIGLVFAWYFFAKKTNGISKMEMVGIIGDRLKEAINLVLVLWIGIGIPGFIIYISIGGIGVLENSSGLYTLFGRGVQFVLIAIASTFPAMLYFLFKRQHFENLQENFFHEMMLLDPELLTTDEAKTKYTPMINQVYSSGSSGMVLDKDLSVILCTLLITLGWLLTMQPLGLIENVELKDLLIAQASAFNFGFLGTYFFALNMLFRRYLNADLTSKAYTHIIVRILTTTILIWTLSQSESNTWNAVLFPLSFIIGVVPETGVALIQEVLKKSVGSLMPSLAEAHPLSDLEGVTLYDQARLLEEGIENVENLAHANLIELRLRTRISMMRLVDLFDQAILYLHLESDITLSDVTTGSTTSSGVTSNSATPSSVPRSEPPSPSVGSKDNKPKEILRRYGIRTATDLERAYKISTQKKAFLGLLGFSVSVESQQVPRLRAIMDSLYDDDWMAYLRHWRKVDMETETIEKPEDLFYHLYQYLHFSRPLQDGTVLAKLNQNTSVINPQADLQPVSKVTEPLPKSNSEPSTSVENVSPDGVIN